MSNYKIIIIKWLINLKYNNWSLKNQKYFLVFIFKIQE